MTSERQAISDPTSVRALAHPLRLQLLDLLGMESELTATQCAERTGESVASCSFHLRMLAKYGYVVPGEPRGREKPWKLASRSRTISPDYDDPASVEEVSVFAQLVVDREAGRLKRWLARAGRELPEWTDATPLTTTSLWLTADEAKEMSTAIMEVHQRFSERFRQRRDDPTTRPAGARPVHVLGASSVDPAAESAA